MSKFTFQFVTPILLFFFMLFDGQMTQVFAGIFPGEITPVSHLLLIFLIYSTTQHKSNYILILSALIGIIYDSYYLGIYGIATLLLPLIVLFVYNLQSAIFTSWWTRLFAVIIVVTIFEAASFAISTLFGFTNTNPLQFVVYQLAPTLLLNSIYIILLQVPINMMYRLQKGKLNYKRN